MSDDEEVPEAQTITITIAPEGMHISIPDDLSPFMLAGIAAYLERMANVGFVNLMQQSQQPMGPQLLVPQDHLQRGGKRRN